MSFTLGFVLKFSQGGEVVLKNCRHEISMFFLLTRNFLVVAFILFSGNLYADMNKGVMIHFLPTVPDAKSRVAKIDVSRMVDDVKKTGAQYFVITLGQNKGQYLFDGVVLNQLCFDYKERDIGFDFLDRVVSEFNDSGLSVIFYLPFRAPQFDKYLASCLGDTPERQPTTEAFLINWSRIIETVSLRYGSRLRGWWLDGAYNTSGISNEKWSVFCSALYAGNADRLVAFNSGEGLANLSKVAAPCQNWAAGEMNNITEIPNDIVFSGAVVPHVLTRISSGWGKKSSPQFDCDQLKRVTSLMKGVSGLLTVDVHYNENYGFMNEHLDLLRSAWVNGCEK